MGRVHRTSIITPPEMSPIMTERTIVLDEIETERKFEDALQTLVRAADENGLDIEGGCDVYPNGEAGWSVEIFRLVPDIEG